MKNFGSTIEYAQERIDDLMKAYFSYLSTCSRISMPDVFEHVVNMPASRFWVSEPRASVVISKILHGDDLHDMRPTKREMFFEIYRRFLPLYKENPDTPISQLVGIVIEQPAPKFYLAPGSAKVMITNAKKKWHEEKKKKLYRW